MEIRRFAPLALALAVLGCQADIPNQAPPSTIVFAITVPSATDATQAVGTQPLSPPGPNDLTLQAATCTPASQALSGCALPPPIPQPTLGALQAFATAGGYPALAPPANAVPFPITIQFIEKAVTSSPSCVPAANATPPFPDIDPTTVTASTLALVRYDTGTPTQVPFTVASYDPATGVLTVIPTAGWDHPAPLGGRYVAALRSGSTGVKTSTGQPVVIAAQTSAFLISQDEDLTKAESQGFLETCLQEPVLTRTAAQLEALRQVYSTPRFWTNVVSPPFPATLGWTPVPPSSLPSPLPVTLPSAFAALDTVFPHREIATIQTFVIAP
jgi:hypothetical protein